MSFFTYMTWCKSKLRLGNIITDIIIFRMKTPPWWFGYVCICVDIDEACPIGWNSLMSPTSLGSIFWTSLLLNAQIVDFPTCFSINSDAYTSLFDLFLTSSSDSCRALQLCLLGNSDVSFCWYLFPLSHQVNTTINTSAFCYQRSDWGSFFK